MSKLDVDAILETIKSRMKDSPKDSFEEGYNRGISSALWQIRKLQFGITEEIKETCNG